MKNFIPRIGCMLLGSLIGIYLTLPLFKNLFFMRHSERMLLESFLTNFVNVIEHLQLPLWNQFVSSGQPFAIIGLYPLAYSTLFYAIFGYSSKAFATLACIDVAILFSTYMYLARRLGFSILTAAVGATVYLAVGWTTCHFFDDSVSGMVAFLPAVFFLLILNIDAKLKNRFDIFSYFLAYLLFSTGQHITWLFTHAAFLCMAGFI